MAASTSIKVATITGSAKDDFLSVLEDQGISNTYIVDVLANDPGSAKLYSLAQVSGTSTSTQFPVQTSLQLDHGQVVISPDGQLVYIPTFDVQTLAAGEHIDETFSYTIRMANGALSTAKATFTIVGQNDAATFSGDDTQSLDENGGPVGGTLKATDLDHDQSLMQAATVQGNYGKLAIGTDGAWTYSLDRAQDWLAEGDKLTDAITVKSYDGTEHQIAITINGTNDAATFSGDDALSIDENGSTVGGTLVVTDLDHDQSSAQADSIDGTYGKLTIGTDGAWTYALNSAQDWLAEGDKLTDAITVKSYDGTEHQIAITITGSNDAATFGGDTEGSVTEDSILTTGGKLTVSDPDHDQSHFANVADSALQGKYGSFTFDTNTGVWTYALNNDAAQGLNSGDTAYDQLVVTSVDGTAATIKVAINGADEPVVPAPTPDPIVENPVVNHVVNYGKNVVNGFYVLNGFDSNDTLSAAGQVKYLGSFTTADYGNDGVMDTVIDMSAKVQQGTENFELVLVGYTGFTGNEFVG